MLVAVGVIITSVGLGDRGFRTLELRMVKPLFILIVFIVIVIKVGPCLLGLGVMMVTLRLLFCRGLPCTRGLASDIDDIIMVRPRDEEEEDVRSEEAASVMRQLVEGNSYKARIIVNHHSYNK